MKRNIVRASTLTVASFAMAACSLGSSPAPHAGGASDATHIESALKSQPAPTSLTQQKAPQPITDAARTVKSDPDDVAGASSTSSSAATASGSPDATGSPVFNAQNTAYQNSQATSAPSISSSRMPANRILVGDGIAYASIIPSATTVGFLNVPQQAWRVGWQKSSAALSAPSGDTVIAGHSDFNTIPGAFTNLSKAKINDTIWTTDATGKLTSWRVASIASYPKGQLPTFWLDGARHLELVTCGGSRGWVKNSSGGRSWLHQDNLVVTAVPTA